MPQPPPSPRLAPAGLLGVLMIVAIGLSGCGAAPEGPSAAEQAVAAQRAEAEAQAAQRHAEAVEAWRKERLERLQRPDGWLALVGLHWLERGNSIVGSGPTRGLRLAVGPDELGVITLEGDGTVRFRASRGAGVSFDGKPAPAGAQRLRTDADPAGPTVVGFNGGDASFIVIERSGRHALRVRDALAPTRTGFTGIDHFPVTPDWRLVGRFEPNPPGQTLATINMQGQEEFRPNPGAVVFEKAGQSFRLEAVDEGDGRLFLIFADRTSGHETYAAVRFLYADPPGADQRVILDFNRAFNPPCAFTPYSTCPLPPPGNRLDLRIEAGEKKPRPPDAAA